ncbi:MAG: glycosyltransferase family 39 protein, partial [Candidatus Eisenbacteria bacterium]|nr:glycosyltransferase family 39 protein [Candidatus Eisenbacteria bacterium]
DRSRRGSRAAFPGVWLAVFIVALALRGGYAWIATGPRATPSSDPATYDTVAWNLARGAGFSLDSPAATGAPRPYPTAFVPPLVPWMTSLLYRAAGHRYFAAVLLQCVVGALVPLLLAAFAGAFFGGTVARWAAWIAAVHPLLVFFSGYLLTEATFCATLLLALYMSADWTRTPRAGRALGAGIAWGVAALTRPTALTMPLVVALWAWRPLGLTVGASERAKQLAILALGIALTVGPWTIRNAIVLHAFVPVTTGGGGALMVANNPRTWDVPESRGGADSESYRAALAGAYRGLNEIQIDARARAETWAFMRARNAEWAAVVAAKLARFWRLTAEGGGTGSWQRAGSPLAALRADPLLLWSLVTLPLALWGALRALRGPRRWFQSLPLLVVLHFTLIAAVFFGSLRMRVPIEPMVALLVAVGADDLRRRLRARAHGLTVMDGRGSAAATER